jgi:hypothetical protein
MPPPWWRRTGTAHGFGCSKRACCSCPHAGCGIYDNKNSDGGCGAACRSRPRHLARGGGRPPARECLQAGRTPAPPEAPLPSPRTCAADSAQAAASATSAPLQLRTATSGAGGGKRRTGTDRPPRVRPPHQPPNRDAARLHGGPTHTWEPHVHGTPRRGYPLQLGVQKKDLKRAPPGFAVALGVNHGSVETVTGPVSSTIRRGCYEAGGTHPAEPSAASEEGGPPQGEGGGGKGARAAR